jgi:hypothetical protein
MASYDTPGYSATLPLAGTRGDFDPRQGTAPGSPPVGGAPVATGTTATSALLTDPYSGPRASRVSVGADDVNEPNQAPATDPVSGVGGIDRTGAGDGRAGHFDHPNNGARS